MSYKVIDLSVRLRSLVLFWIFVCVPLFDMLNGYLIVRGYLPEVGIFSPSQIGRIIASFLLLISALRERLKIYWVYFLCVGVLFELVAWYQFGEIFWAAFGFVTVYRLAYIWLLFTVLQKYAKDNVGLLGNYLKYNVLLVSLSILVAQYTGLGNSTYGWGFGTKGFFASGNGLGIYLGVAILTLMTMRYYKIYAGVGWLTFIIGLSSILLIGSKTSFLLSIIIVFFWIWFSHFRLIFLFGFVVMALLLSPYIIEALGVMFDVIITRYQNSNSLVSFLTSERLDYVQSAFSTYGSQNVGFLRFLIGGGSYVSFQKPNNEVVYDTLEMDIVDSFFMYGIIGFLFYFSLIVYGIILLRSKFFLLVIWLVIISHSILAGHVIFNGMNVTLLSYLLALGCSIKALRKAKKINVKIGAIS